jgi:SulP family sulfate permease
MGAIGSVGADVRVVVLALGGVPSIDATGFVALESSIKRLRSLGKQVILAGPLPHPRSVFERANLAQHHEHVHFAQSLVEGLVAARALAESAAPNQLQRPASHTA